MDAKKSKSKSNKSHNKHRTKRKSSCSQEKVPYFCDPVREKDRVKEKSRKRTTEEYKKKDKHLCEQKSSYKNKCNSTKSTSQEKIPYFCDPIREQDRIKEKHKRLQEEKLKKRTSHSHSPNRHKNKYSNFSEDRKHQDLNNYRRSPNHFKHRNINLGFNNRKWLDFKNDHHRIPSLNSFSYGNYLPKFEKMSSLRMPEFVPIPIPVPSYALVPQEWLTHRSFYSRHSTMQRPTRYSSFTSPGPGRNYS